MSKKYLSALILLGVLTISVAPFVASADMWTVPTAGKVTDIKTIMTAIFTPLWQLFAGIAVIMFVVAGVLFLTSMGDPGKLATARNAVIWGVVGIVVAVIAFSIVTIVSGWI